jgi:Fe-S cluster assembly scaffold protein SufB
MPKNCFPTIKDLIILKKLSRDDQKIIKQYGIEESDSITKSLKKLKTKLAEPNSTTIPTSYNQDSNIEHEATTSKVSQDILWYSKSRGLIERKTTSLVVTGFSKNIIQNLPMEFMIETRNLIQDMIDKVGIG